MKDIEIIIENFKIPELSCKCCGKFNMTDRHIINLQALRYKYDKPLIVTSGCRCKKHNAEVGGVATSRHECSSKKADATDIKPKLHSDLEEIYKIAIQLDIFKEVILYEKSQFVHVATFPDKKIKYFDIVNK